MLDRLRAVDLVDDGAGESGAGLLQLDDDFLTWIARKHITKRRHVKLRELGRGSVVQWSRCGRRAIEQAIVMDHHDPVARQVHVELEAVGTVGQPLIEGCHRIFRREGAAAAVREDERAGRGHCRMHAPIL